MGYDPYYGAVLCDEVTYKAIEASLAAQKDIHMLDHGYLHGNWCFFQPFDAWLSLPETRQFVGQLSREHAAAFLHYWISEEDIGYCLDEELETLYRSPGDCWGYRIFIGGEEVASVMLPLDIEPWEDTFDAAVKAGIENAHPEHFACFDLGQDVQQSIQQMLSADSISRRANDVDMLAVAVDMQKYLGIAPVFYAG